VPYTSTFALTNVTTRVAEIIAEHGILEAARRNGAIAKGVNTWDGKCTLLPVAQVAHVPFTPVDELI
jgi:alanine dehydrogenase